FLALFSRRILQFPIANLQSPFAISHLKFAIPFAAFASLRLGEHPASRKVNPTGRATTQPALKMPYR
ncbi:MAG TPA: hypothetical protein VNO70_17465, partial [Blastocatellia bacterium]|nr:hypothetical protein [Blastocatellia bacterium]